MRLKIVNIKDVAESHLCCGCGVCSYLDPKQVTMVDDFDQGRRPLTSTTPELTPEHRAALSACPGKGLTQVIPDSKANTISSLSEAWGPILEVWRGHATSEEIRFRASSGGIATALAIFAIEQCGYRGVLHTASREDVPYLNKTVLSTTASEVLACTGSRYAPASPCDGLGLIESGRGECMFIGKPCDVAAVQQARKQNPALDSNLGITIGVFCAGTPTTKGTLEALRHLGVEDPESVLSVRYRGHGWPGDFCASVDDREGHADDKRMSYAESWGKILQKHRQWRCYICPDHTGEFADISVGDAWESVPKNDDAGISLVLVRTERGKQFLADAIQAGVLTISPAAPSSLQAAQPNLLNARSVIWPRLAGLIVSGAAAPRYQGFHIFRLWLRNTGFIEKVRSFVGTVRRVFKKRLNQRRPVVPHE